MKKGNGIVLHPSGVLDRDTLKELKMHKGELIEDLPEPLKGKVELSFSPKGEQKFALGLKELNILLRKVAQVNSYFKDNPIFIVKKSKKPKTIGMEKWQPIVDTIRLSHKYTLNKNRGEFTLNPSLFGLEENDLEIGQVVRLAPKFLQAMNIPREWGTPRLVAIEKDK